MATKTEPAPVTSSVLEDLMLNRGVQDAMWQLAYPDQVS